MRSGSCKSCDATYANCSSSRLERANSSAFLASASSAALRGVMSRERPNVRKIVHERCHQEGIGQNRSRNLVPIKTWPSRRLDLAGILSIRRKQQSCGAAGAEQQQENLKSERAPTPKCKQR